MVASGEIFAKDGKSRTFMGPIVEGQVSPLTQKSWNWKCATPLCMSPMKDATYRDHLWNAPRQA